MAKTHTSGCYFCHALKRPYEPAERATALEANVDWHRHVLADHADLAWTQDNEARVREFIEANTQPSDLPTSRRGEAGDGPSTTFDPAPLGSHTQPSEPDHTNGSR